MADLITWAGISFYVKSNEIRGVKDISIKASAETEDKTQSSEKFTKKKNAGSYQISLTVVLNAALGVNVQQVATSITEAARVGTTGYFYTASGKLFPSNFMAVDATISNIRMNGAGVWTYCEVQWTLKQCSKYDGTTSGSSKKSSSSGKSSSKKSSSSSKKKTTKTSALDVVKKAASTVKSVVTSVVSTVKKVVGTISSAKKASAKAYSNLTKKKTSSGGGGKYLKLTK